MKRSSVNVPSCSATSLKSLLTTLKADVPHISDVRGPGGMVAVEICMPGTGEADAAFASASRRWRLNAACFC